MTSQTTLLSKQAEVYDYHGRPLVVPLAPQGKAALMCQCGEFATYEQEDQAVREHFYLCSSCGKHVFLGRHSGIKEDALTFYDTDVTLNSHWYHATASEDWFNAITNANPLPMVHIGTKFAAESRARVMRDSIPHRGKQWWIYQLSIKPGTDIAPLVLDDFNGDAPETSDQAEQHLLYAENGVTRYLNRYESVGSISLLANPHCLVVVDKFRFNNNF